MDLKSLCIVFKAERNHRVENVLAADRLSLLELALLRRLGRDEANKLGHALLHALLGVLRDFCRRRHGILHDTRNIRNLFVCFFDGGGGGDDGDGDDDDDGAKNAVRKEKDLGGHSWKRRRGWVDLRADNGPAPGIRRLPVL